MIILIYFIAAAVIGWVSTEIMRDLSNLLTNIIVAVLGAFLASYFLGPIFNVGTINDAVHPPNNAAHAGWGHHPARHRQCLPPQQMSLI